MDLSNCVPILQAVEAVTGSPPHIQSVRRWIKRGVRGVRLQASFVAGKYLTSEVAVREFIAATTQARLDAPKRSRAKKQPRPEELKNIVGYRVETATGSTVHESKSLDAAMEAAEGKDAVPYIISKKGRRPVVDECIGRFGESVEDLRARIYGEVVA